MDELPNDQFFIIDTVHDRVEDEDENDNEESWKDADFLSFGNKNDVDTGDKKAAENDKGEQHSKFNQQRQREKKIDPNFIPTVSIHTGELAPWQTLKCLPPLKRSNRNPNPVIPPLLALHNEIVGFAKVMSPHQLEIEAREKVIADIDQVSNDVFGGPEKYKIVVFGSQATRLFLPTSDIDIVIYLPNGQKEGMKDGNNEDNKENVESEKAKERREMEEWENETDTRSPLRRLADGIRSFYKDDLTYLDTVENTRIPIVKFTHGPTGMSVDVCFNQEGGPEAAQMMNKFLEDMPPLRPLVFVLKYFMAIRGINEPYSGGMGSFMLQMMIVSFLQHRAREEYTRYRRSIIMNLGALLLEFFEFYSLDFNYYTTAISVRNDGSYFPKGASEKRENFYQPLRPSSLAIENPMDLTSDVGKSTFRMNHIQRSFDVAFRVLLSHVSQPLVPAKSILASILPPTDEIRKRAILMNSMEESESNSDDEDETMDSSSQTTSSSRKKQKKQKKPRKNAKKRNRSLRDTQYSDSSDEDNYFPQHKKRKNFKGNKKWSGGQKKQNSGKLQKSYKSNR